MFEFEEVKQSTSLMWIWIAEGKMSGDIQSLSVTFLDDLLLYPTHQNIIKHFGVATSPTCTEANSLYVYVTLSTYPRYKQSTIVFRVHTTSPTYMAASSKNITFFEDTLYPRNTIDTKQ